MNTHNAPARTGATAYGQIRSVRYVVVPLITLSANPARISAKDIERKATQIEKNIVLPKLSKYISSVAK